VSLKTYFGIVISFIKQGYSLTSVNSTLIPFWYSPETIDESVLEYTNYFKLHEKTINYSRVTYYQNNEWRDDTVGMIYKDLLNSEGAEEYAITWIITLLSNTNFFHTEIQNVISFEENINYLKQPGSNETIKKIKEVVNDKNKLNQFSSLINSHSKKMTELVMSKFRSSMGEQGCYSCSKTQYEDIFGKFIKEIGYFKKGDSAFAINLIGKLSDTVTLQIISDKEDLQEIKTNIDQLIRLNATKR
ncbi:MAG TPA: hypothetical protein VNW06_05455, partial [Cytophagaceae bacterium]|nr:hypothetical protein [Cytophagaceae bacterium]